MADTLGARILDAANRLASWQVGRQRDAELTTLRALAAEADAAERVARALAASADAWPDRTAKWAEVTAALAAYRERMAKGVGDV